MSASFVAHHTRGYTIVSCTPDVFFVIFCTLCWMLGQGQASSSYPCPYCEIKITVDTTVVNQLKAGKPRTWASNRRHFKKNSNHNRKPIVSEHRSCISDPLQLFPQTTDIITFIRLPQLHLFLHANWYIDKIEELIRALRKHIIRKWQKI